MTRTLSLAASLAVMLALLVGCGGGAGPGAPAGVAQAPSSAAPASAPTAAPATSPPTQARTLADYAGAAKSDLRQAVSTIESYAMDNGGYTAALGAPGLPATVTIVAVRPDGYSLAAGTADGATYAIERVGSTTSKRCAPLDRVFCQTGDW